MSSCALYCLIFGSYHGFPDCSVLRASLSIVIDRRRRRAVELLDLANSWASLFYGNGIVGISIITSKRSNQHKPLKYVTTSIDCWGLVHETLWKCAATWNLKSWGTFNILGAFAYCPPCCPCPDLGPPICTNMWKATMLRSCHLQYCRCSDVFCRLNSNWQGTMQKHLQMMPDAVKESQTVGPEYRLPECNRNYSSQIYSWL